MEENEGSPQLKGIVIISLPPPENPSLGKTITAITFSENTQSPIRQAPVPVHQVEPLGPSSQPPQSQENHEVQGRFSSRSLLFSSPVVFSCLLSLSLIALFYWVSSTREILYELRDADNDHTSNSIIFPLYPKLGTGGNVPPDAELKLGKFVDSNSKNVMETLDGRKLVKSMISESKVDSTTIFPVSGNIHSEGYVFVLDSLAQNLSIHVMSIFFICSDVYFMSNVVLNLMVLLFLILF